MEAAAEGVQDRLVKDNLTLDIRAAAGIGSFTADERRLRQILFNLLSNAVGFSPPGATVTLRPNARAGCGGFLASPTTGPGIPPDAQDKVFDWFETDPRGSQHRGPGLGLSLVRSFVELHGGTVTIDFGARWEHHGHLRIPGRARGKAERGLANKCPSRRARAGRAVSLGVAREILL